MSAPAPRPPAAGAMRQATVVVGLMLMLGIQPVTTDLYLPALPTLARDLGASPGTAQLTLSALIVCFGLAQLVWGPLSDRFGRRPILLSGLALYCVAALGAALAPTIGWLVAWRALQGVGMAAAVTCGRSIIRDLYEPREGARVMSRALGGLGLLAMASPLLGGLLVEHWHWRATLAAVTLFGAVAMAFVALRFVETLAQPDPRGTEPRHIAANWRRILAHPTFIAWAALLCASWGGLFALLASSSFVFIEVLGASRQVCGAMLASCSITYIGGTLLCRLLLRHGNASRAAAVGATFSLGGGALLASVSLAGAASIASVMPGLWLYAVGHGVCQPCGQAGVTSPFPDSAGTAASLSGFLMMATAFGVGLLLAAVMNATVFPLTLTVGAFGAAVAAVAWTLVRVHGDRRVLAPAARIA
jgi:MFS transporter, DHA1 family, multidrug resistance protein